jgi:hypothetical protein
MLLRLTNTAKLLRNQLALQHTRILNWTLRRKTRRPRKVIDKFEDEEARERAAEIGDGGEKGHVCAADMRVGDFGVEGADGDEHDRRHEGAEDVFNNHQQQVWAGNLS